MLSGSLELSSHAVEIDSVPYVRCKCTAIGAENRLSTIPVRAAENHLLRRPTKTSVRVTADSFLPSLSDG